MASDYGLVLKGIRDNDRSVTNAGINIYWFKAQALFLSSAVGAFAGAYMTHVYMFVGMPVFALDYSIMPIASAVVGGVGSFAGASAGRIHSGTVIGIATRHRRPENCAVWALSGNFYRCHTRGHLSLSSKKISAG